MKQKGTEALKVSKDIEYTAARAQFRGDPEPDQDGNHAMAAILRDLQS